MERGVAFIRGIGMFGRNNYKKEEILECLDGIKSFKIVGMYGNDNIIFEKEGMHYASAGKIIENALERKFGKKFYVTTRSMSTIKTIGEKFSH
jgi:uncharacterized protein (DUF1697 family)